MKAAKFVLFGLSILMFVAQRATMACGSSILVGSASTFDKYIQAPSGTPDVDYIAYYWQLGTPANNSGTQPTFGPSPLCNGILWDGTCWGDANWHIQGDWGNPGSSGGCPGASNHTILKIEQRTNEGALTHTASLLTLDIPLAANMAYDTDAVMGSGTTAYVTFPKPSASWVSNPISGTVSTTSGSPTVTGSGTSFTTALVSGQHIQIGGVGYIISSITNDTTLQLSTNATSTLSGVPLNAEYIQITFTPWPGNAGTYLAPSGYNIYALPPASAITSNRSAWGTPLNASPITSSPALLPYKTIATGQYYAMSILFDSNQVETTFVGPNCDAVIGPTPAGVFASCEASLKKGQVTVTWRTNVETGTARFVVETSKNENGPFTEVAGTETEPKGNHAFYTAAFPNPYPGAKKFFVRVKAADFDGKEYFSNTVKITRKTAQKYGKEILLDDGE